MRTQLEHHRRKSHRLIRLCVSVEPGILFPFLLLQVFGVSELAFVWLIPITTSSGANQSLAHLHSTRSRWWLGLACPPRHSIGVLSPARACIIPVSSCVCVSVCLNILVCCFRLSCAHGCMLPQYIPHIGVMVVPIVSVLGSFACLLGVAESKRRRRIL